MSRHVISAHTSEVTNLVYGRRMVDGVMSTLLASASFDYRFKIHDLTCSKLCVQPEPEEITLMSPDTYKLENKVKSTEISRPLSPQL